MATIYTPEEAAAYLRVHVNTIYTLLRSGRIPAARVGRGWRISADSLNKYLRTDETRTAEDSTWLELDLAGLGRVEPYDWGPEGIPETTPVRYVAGKGVIIEGERRFE